MSSEANVYKLPTCDFHKGEHEAEYDFKTFQGPWGNGCEDAWKQWRAYPELGTGKGQHLVVRNN
jgi:hypothetical protein